MKIKTEKKFSKNSKGSYFKKNFQGVGLPFLVENYRFEIVEFAKMYFK